MLRFVIYSNNVSGLIVVTFWGVLVIYIDCI